MSFAECHNQNTVDENGEHVRSAKVTKKGPGAIKCRADHGAEQTLCLWSKRVLKTHGAVFEKGLT